MTERTASRARSAQRCRTLILAAALGVVLTSFSLVDRAWPGVVVGVIGTIVVIVLYRRECWGDAPDTASRDA